jgi:hypothetical protein
LISYCTFSMSLTFCTVHLDFYPHCNFQNLQLVWVKTHEFSWFAVFDYLQPINIALTMLAMQKIQHCTVEKSVKPNIKNARILSTSLPICATIIIYMIYILKQLLWLSISLLKNEEDNDTIHAQMFTSFNDWL